MRIILASASRQRKEILDMIGLKYEVIPSDIEEKSNKKRSNKYVEELSLKKAKSVADKVGDNAIIIAADTIIYFNNKKYEKPKSKEEAFYNLKELSGNKNSAYTGITIIDLYQNKTITTSSKVEVYFKKMTNEEINWYINNESKIYTSCGYVPEGKAALFIDKINGDYNTLLGISPSILIDELKSLNYSLEDLF